METVLRVLVAYVFIVFGLRMVGKRSFGQLSPADLVVLMLIPEFFQQPISREDFSITNAFVAVATLLIAVVATDTLGYRFPRLGNVISGKPVTVRSLRWCSTRVGTSRPSGARIPPFTSETAITRPIGASRSVDR